ncbi:MAG: hypothetical protein CL666_11915 [Balneola sp.]|nr:hypothetical protein [Balneola sp.]|tara:strand:+ start:5940 stop:6209 length:270 start_codon:yes stop_codon:yes gene_type:complete
MVFNSGFVALFKHRTPHKIQKRNGFFELISPQWETIDRYGMFIIRESRRPLLRIWERKEQSSRNILAKKRSRRVLLSGIQFFSRSYAAR